MARTQAELKIDEEAESGASGPVPGVQALTRGVQLLDLVASAATPPRFTELLDRSGMPKGTLHRMLQALVDERLLKLDGRDQTYRLGSRLFQWAHRVWDDFDLRGAAEPELERLRDLTGETVRLGILDGGRDSLHRPARGAAARAPQQRRRQPGQALCQRPRQGDPGASLARDAPQASRRCGARAPDAAHDRGFRRADQPARSHQGPRLCRLHRRAECRHQLGRCSYLRSSRPSRSAPSASSAHPSACRRSACTLSGATSSRQPGGSPAILARWRCR